MKKILSVLLLFVCLWTFIGCGEEEKENILTVEVVEKVYVGEKSNYVVKLNDVDIFDYNYESEDTSILEIGKGTVSGVKAGTTTIVISKEIDDKLIKVSKEVTVNEKEVINNYELVISCSEELTVGDKAEIVVKEKIDNVVITDFTVFTTEEGIVEYSDGKLTALKSGSTVVKVATKYKGYDLVKEFNIVVKEPEVIKFKVDFLDKDGNIIETIEVEKGKDAIAPNPPVFDGFAFKEWDKDFTNVTSDIVVNAIYDKLEDERFDVNIPATIYVGQIIDVVVKYDDKEISDYEVLIGNEDILYFDGDSLVLEAFDIGNSSLEIIINIDGIDVTYSLEIVVLPGFELTVEGDFSLIEGDEVVFDVFVEPDHIKVADFMCTPVDTKVVAFENGKILAKGFGKTKVAVSTIYNGISITKVIEVVVNRYIEPVVDTNIQDYLFMNNTLTLEAKVSPFKVELENVEVKVADESVIKFENNIFTALKLGSTQITIKGTYLDKEISKTYDVTVYEIDDIKVEVESSLLENEVLVYSVYALPNNVKLNDYSYKVSNDNILVNKGLLLGNKEGLSTLTISYNVNSTNIEKSVDLEVKELKRKVERLYLDCPQGILEGGQVSVAISSYPENIEYEVIYKSSDENIATVDQTGNVTAKSTGKCYITVQLKENENIKTSQLITVIKKNEKMEFSGSTSAGEYCGTYTEESVKYYYELMNGITETTYYAYTSTLTAGIDVDGYTGISGTIEPGKDYPQTVHVLQVPSTTKTKIVPWANLNGDIWTLTSVKGLIQDYEEKHPGEKVICAINGDFFDINANGNLPYQTTGENVSDGEFFKTTNGFGGGGGTIGFTNDGSSTSLVASHDVIRTTNMILAIYDENGNVIKEYEVESLNTEPQDGQSSVYFGIYNENKTYVPAELNTSKNVYYIENAERALPNNATDFYGLGTISSVTTGATMSINKGSFAIVSDNQEINNALKEGLRIRLQYEFTGEFENVKSATGFNTTIYNDPNQLPEGYIGDRAPRTVVGVKADGTIVMMVIDGRQGGDDMYGADGSELAAIMKTYGCIECYNLDGGGSSTIVVREESGLKVLNTPSDGRERSDGNCVLMVMEDPGYKVDVTTTDSTAKFNVTTINENYKDYETYIMIENEIYKTENGLLEIENLVHNNTYGYQVLYKDGDTLYNTLTIGSFLTKKSGFKFLGIVLEETDDEYIFTVNYDDNDKCSNISEMKIVFNGIESYFAKGKITLSKDIFGEYIQNITFGYWYLNNNGERIDVELKEYQDYFRK